MNEEARAACIEERNAVAARGAVETINDPDGITVRDLIEALGAFDPDAKVYTIVTCECCTGFRQLTAEGVGRRRVGVHALDPYRPADLRRLPQLPKEPAVPCVVVAEAYWTTFYPEVEGDEPAETA